LKALRKIFPVGHFIISLLFVACAATLIVFSVQMLGHAILPAAGAELYGRLNAVLEAIALLTISVASLELGETNLEEEVQREAQMSAPTRVRRFLSRFLIVLVVALSIETLVAVFKFVHEDPSQLPNAAFVGWAAAALLAAWGIFVQLNLGAERLEPEALQHAKAEDRKVE
jgi:hypothetical protein